MPDLPEAVAEAKRAYRQWMRGPSPGLRRRFEVKASLLAMPLIAAHEAAITALTASHRERDALRETRSELNLRINRALAALAKGGVEEARGILNRGSDAGR